jgi:TIR domain
MLGFQPWLDEDALVAGEGVDRAMLRGMKESCAAVFFITPAFRDTSFLAQEIEYAIAEKREKRNRFGIITLVFANDAGEKGTVPDLLRTFVWKAPCSQLEALTEILRALPIEVGPVRWRM